MIKKKKNLYIGLLSTLENICCTEEPFADSWTEMLPIPRVSFETVPFQNHFPLDQFLGIVCKPAYRFHFLFKCACFWTKQHTLHCLVQNKSNTALSQKPLKCGGRVSDAKASPVLYCSHMWTTQMWATHVAMPAAIMSRVSIAVYWIIIFPRLKFIN